MFFFTKRALSRVQRRRWYLIELANDRNALWAEMEHEQKDWHQKVEAARKMGWPLPVGGGIIKARFEIAAGLRGIESGWDIDSVPVADFGNVNNAATTATTIRTGFSTFPLVNVAQTLTNSPDPLPYQLSTLAATNASRVAGSSTNPLAVVVGAYCGHVTGTGTVYNPAGANTVLARVISTVATTGAGFTSLTTALNLTTDPNFVAIMTISAPAERQIPNPQGTLLTNVSGIFNGDTHFAELAVAASTNHIGNLLFVELECI